MANYKDEERISEVVTSACEGDKQEKEPADSNFIKNKANVENRETIYVKFSKPNGAVRASTCENGRTQVLCPCIGNYISVDSVQKVYAIGSIGYDFGTEAREDSFRQRMESWAREKGIKDRMSPNHFPHLVEYLKSKNNGYNNLWDTSAMIWILRMNSIPVYAIAPAGPFAQETFRFLLETLEDQMNDKIERVSLPGIITGQTTLMNGQVIPVVSPDLRGMYSWTTKALVEAARAALKGESKKETVDSESVDAYVRVFLERIYHETNNFGMTSEERALNYAATNALNVTQIVNSTIGKSLNLASIQVEKSAICRPGSDCQEVILKYFNPKQKTEQAVQAFRFTVDVSDILPVTVGTIRSWNEY